MRRPALIAVALYVIGVALFAGFVAVPFATKHRQTPAEVPSPPPLRNIDLLNVGPGSRLCLTDLVVSAQARGMTFSLGTYRRPGPPLDTTITAGDYSSTRTVAGGYADNSAIQVPIPPPPSSRAAEVCITNRGKRKIAFYGSGLDPARSRVRAVLDNSYQGFTPTFTFTDGDPSIAGNAGVTAGRIAVFRGFLDHAWIVWLLAVAMVAVVPVLVGVALAASGRQWRSDSSAG